MNKEDQFQVWLIDMDDAIERFRLSLPPDVARKLDFSADSLGLLENAVLNKYSSIDDLKKSSETNFWDGAARYVGEVFRQHCGGKWTIDYSDPKFVFYGVPIMLGMPGQTVALCPQSLVTASLDRRTGTFIKKVFDAYFARCVNTGF